MIPASEKFDARIYGDPPWQSRRMQIACRVWRVHVDRSLDWILHFRTGDIGDDLRIRAGQPDSGMEFAVAGGQFVCVARNGADAFGAMECREVGLYSQRAGYQ